MPKPSRDIEPGYRLKLHRAKQHLDFIDSQARAWMKDDLGTPIGFEPKPENEWTIIRRDEVTPLDPMWGTYVGDVIHNIRSALDNLVSDMIRRNEPDHSLAHAGFPAYEGDLKWMSEIVNRDRTAAGPAPTDGVSPKVLAAIEQSQPYHIKGTAARRRAPLLLLQRASNSDKHRALHATHARIAPREVHPGRIRFAPPGCFAVMRKKIAAPGTPIETGAEIARVKLRVLVFPPPDSDMGVYVQAPMEIAFSVDGHELVHPDLWFMLRDAWGVIRRPSRGLRPWPRAFERRGA